MEDRDHQDVIGTHTATNEVALAIEMVEALGRLADMVRERVGSALLEANINETRLIVMRNIAARGDAGCSQAELASVLRQAESSVCTLIERMKKDGLVHRFRSKVDRRKSFLMLTQDGQDQLELALRHYYSTVKELQSVWGPERSSKLRQLLDDLLFALERPGQVASDISQPAKAA